MDNIYVQLKEVIDRGSEQDVRAFLSNPENLAKFPPNVQAEIVGAFFEEQLENTGGSIGSVERFKDRGIEMAQELEAGKRTIEDVIKVKDIQEKLAG
ncbi:MAG: hypothetical protein HY617_00770 [Candidatus Sungbacteria bacterium]|nr:hypothetical protein [Candidatus Sungbacteria bacterium]